MAGLLALFCGFFLADFIFRQNPVDTKLAGEIPFSHGLHGDSIGLDCSLCHTGVKYQAHAYMPSKTDCLDCHRLPLTEGEEAQKLDSILSTAQEYPWNHKKFLPEHVVFHHGVHYAAGVQCGDCHVMHDAGKGRREQYGGELFSMKMCLDCHSKKTFKDRDFKPAAVYCGACHR